MELTKEVFLKPINSGQPQNDGNSSHTVIKSAVKFASGTFLSRIGGLVRDISMAFCFGTEPAIAAFLVAFRLANLLRRIFGEGALLNSFVPHFESYRDRDPKHAAQFFRDIFFSLMFLLVVLVGVIESALLCWYLFGEVRESNQQIVFLTMIMLPGLLFICLFSLCSGLLQCEKNFFLTGVAPLVFNVIWIGSIWYFKDYVPTEAVIYLSVSIILAFFFQWAILFPKTIQFLRRYLSWKELFQFSFFSQEIRSMISAMSMGVIGVSAVQINSAVDSIFARYASLEGPAYLNYAIHVQQLPLALFGIGISTALLPPLSRAIKDSNLYKKLLHSALSNALLLLVPCCIAIFVLGSVGINLIYGRGHFNNESITQTTICLWGYGIGLIPMGICLLLAPAFYAKKDYWTPTTAAFLSLGVNFILNVLLVFIFQCGPASLALSTSLAACCNTVFLFYRLSKITGIKFSLSSFSPAFKIMICSLLAGLVTLSVEYAMFDESSLLMLLGKIKRPLTRDIIPQLYQFFLLAGSFTVSFLFLSWALKVKELFQLIRFRDQLQPDITSIRD